jgi:hypothetical protein
LDTFSREFAGPRRYRELVYILAHSPDVAVRFALRPLPASGLSG